MTDMTFIDRYDFLELFPNSEEALNKWQAWQSSFYGCRIPQSEWNKIKSILTFDGYRVKKDGEVVQLSDDELNRLLSS